MVGCLTNLVVILQILQNYISTIEVAFLQGDFGGKHESKQILQHFCSSELKTSTEKAANSNVITTKFARQPTIFYHDLH